MNNISTLNTTADLRWIIVGFDPGLTIGLAIIDLNGNILHITSIKEASHSQIINEIIKYGRVVVVSTDVTNPPKNVKKLATLLNSKIYAPKKSMTIDFKNNLVDEYIKKTKSRFNISNAHERDSLSAAIKSYKHYEKKLKIVDKKCSIYNFTQQEVENIKNEFIMGVPIVKAIKKILDVENSKHLPKKIKTKNIEIKTQELLEKQNIELKKQIKNQKNQIKQLKKHNNNLKELIKNQKHEIKKNKTQINKIHDDYDKNILLNKKIVSKLSLIEKLKKELEMKELENQKLKNQLNSQKQIKKIKLEEDTVVVKIIDLFTKECLNNAIKNWNLKKDDLIYIKNSKGAGSQTATKLSRIKPKTIIISDKLPNQALKTLIDNDIPIIHLENINLTMLDEFAITSSKEIDEEIKKWKLEIENQRATKEKEQIFKAFDEYKAKRKREL